MQRNSTIRTKVGPIWALFNNSFPPSLLLPSRQKEGNEAIAGKDNNTQTEVRFLNGLHISSHFQVKEIKLKRILQRRRSWVIHGVFSWKKLFVSVSRVQKIRRNMISANLPTFFLSRIFAKCIKGPSFSPVATGWDIELLGKLVCWCFWKISPAYLSNCQVQIFTLLRF